MLFFLVDIPLMKGLIYEIIVPLVNKNYILLYLVAKNNNYTGEDGTLYPKALRRIPGKLLKVKYKPV